MNSYITSHQKQTNQKNPKGTLKRRSELPRVSGSLVRTPTDRSITSRIPLPPTSHFSLLTFPLPAGPMTSCAYRGMPTPGFPGAARHTPFSLRATPTEFREPEAPTNSNRRSVYASCSASPLTTESSADQIPRKTRLEETQRVRGREGSDLRMRGR